MIRRNSNRWLFCLTWSYVKNLVTEVQNDRAKPFQAFFQQQQSLLCTFLFVSRLWSFWRSAPTALPCEPPLLYRGQWMEEEKNDGSFQSQIPLPAGRERGEKLICFPSPGKSCLWLTKKSCLIIKTNPVLQLCCAPTLLCFNLFSLEIGRGF